MIVVIDNPRSNVSLLLGLLTLRHQGPRARGDMGCCCGFSAISVIDGSCSIWFAFPYVFSIHHYPFVQIAILTCTHTTIIKLKCISIWCMIRAYAGHHTCQCLNRHVQHHYPSPCAPQQVLWLRFIGALWHCCNAASKVHGWETLLSFLNSTSHIQILSGIPQLNQPCLLRQFQSPWNSRQGLTQRSRF